MAFLEHRASIALAADAKTKLAELELACVEARDKTRAQEERGQQRYHLFGECRFGFREALRAWPDNASAHDGLRRAVVLMAELELSQGDPRAAELLVLELEDAPKDLAERVTKARRARDEKQRRLASMARDLDPAIGRRVRMRVSAARGVL
ncbi:MAG: Serine/threonine-protein kinase PknB, partial [Labilithrix sp.]|nr:Serine/threonine-protein kinase PknB [Labilithrix sp.]